MTLLLAAVDWDTGLNDAWSSIATFVPRLLAFLAILAIGWFVAKAIGAAVNKVLERVGFDKAVERGGIRKALESSKYDASDLLGKVVFFTLFLFVLQLAFGVFGANPVSELLTGVIAFLPRLLVAIVIVVVASAIAAAVKDIVGNALGGLSYGRTLATIASVSILVLGAFMALNQLEIAPAIVNGLFYGLLAVIVGSAIVAIGGGGIVPMRSRWEQALHKVDEEAPRIKEEARQHAEVRGQASVDLRDSTTEMPTPPPVPAASAPATARPMPAADPAPTSPSMSMQERVRQEMRETAGPLDN